MDFNVVAQFGGLRIYTREITAERALRTAEERRHAGAQAVWTYDEAWLFVSAGDLTMAVERERDKSTSRESDRGPTTFAIGMASAAGSNPSPGEAPRSRVRVFKSTKSPRQDD